jgi:hypothetical protein
MKRLIFAFAVIGVGLCSQAAHAVALSECFASSGAVFAAHPNATHASYTSRVKRSERCWYADAFKTEPHAVVAIAQTSASRHAIMAPTPQPRPAAAEFTSQPNTTAIAPAPQARGVATTVPTREPHTTTATPTPRPVAVKFLTQVPRTTQLSLGVSRLSPIDEEAPTDFESRFSVIGYKVPR